MRKASARWTTDRARVFDDLHLTLLPGDHVGITGASGAGKSTLALVLLRFLDPENRGAVLLNGIDMCDIAALLDSASGRTVLMLTHRDEGSRRPLLLSRGRPPRRRPHVVPDPHRFRFAVGASGGHPTRVMSAVPS